MYKIMLEINGKEKFLKNVSTMEEVFDYCNQHISKHSLIESYYTRFWEEDNIITIDYGSHNSFYKIYKD